MLTQEQIARLADTLNEMVDIPFVGEGREKDILVSALGTINGKLGEVGPEFHGIIQAIADGKVDDGEMGGMKARAVEILNARVDVPFVGEGTEAAVLERVVDALIDSARARIRAAMG